MTFVVNLSSSEYRQQKYSQEVAMNIRSKPADCVTAVENALKPAMYAKGQPVAAMNLLERMKYYHVPGVSVAVIDDGKIAWARGYGVKETGGNDPITPETLFQAASISKPVTALGALSSSSRGFSIWIRRSMTNLSPGRFQRMNSRKKKKSPFGDS